MTTTKRGKTERFVINEKFIFGNARCMRCGRVLKNNEYLICEDCKRKRRIF